MEKIFTISAKNNLIILIISYLAYPLTLILKILKFTPNKITLCSIIICILSCYYFLIENTLLLFIFWFLGSILDFCDGQLARITGVINKTAFNFDHLSDLIKIFLIIITSAIYYNNLFYWILSAFVIFLFPLFSVLSSSYKNKNFFKKKSLSKEIFDKNLFFEKVLRNFISIFLKIDGHSLFLIPFLIISQNIASYIIIYFIFVLLLNVIRFSYLLLKIEI